MRRAFARVAATAFCALLWCVAAAVQAASATPGARWERAAPEALGWSSEKLKAADAYASGLNTDAYLVVDRGTIVHEYGAISRATNVHSVRKSVLNLLIGIHVDKGAIALDRTMSELGITDREGLSETEKRATIRHLMQARSGIYHPAAYETKSMAARRPPRGSAQPGERFYYNNWDFNALATIFAKLTGRTVFESLRDDLAGPLQFEDFSIETDTAFRSGTASDHAAYIMRFSARDLARMGLLVARGGRWGGRRIVPEQWITESLESYSETDRGGVGYGYLWWVGLNGRHFRLTFPGKVVSARGHWGQYVVVDMAREIIVVHKVNSEVRPRKAVSARQFGELLKLILAAKS
jgi:CubicO group peptidase (beta-lactamase class C family)